MFSFRPSRLALILTPLALLFILMLGACHAGEETKPAATPTTTATPSPTMTPAPTATPVASAIPVTPTSATLINANYDPSNGTSSDGIYRVKQ